MIKLRIFLWMVFALQRPVTLTGDLEMSPVISKHLIALEDTFLICWNEQMEEIRPVYMQLQGLLSQIPLPGPDGRYSTISDEGIWNQLNEAVDELSQISTKDYSRFKVKPKSESSNGYTHNYVNTVYLRTRIGSLVSRLYAEYFKGEPAPFGGTPSTVINASATATQNLSVQIVNEVKSLIETKTPSYEPGTVEKTFLDQLNEGMGKVTNTADLIKKIFAIGSDLGMTINQIASIFS